MIIGYCRLKMEVGRTYFKPVQLNRKVNSCLEKPPPPKLPCRCCALSWGTARAHPWEKWRPGCEAPLPAVPLLSQNCRSNWWAPADRHRTFTWVQRTDGSNSSRKMHSGLCDVKAPFLVWEDPWIKYAGDWKAVGETPHCACPALTFIPEQLGLETGQHAG